LKKEINTGTVPDQRKSIEVLIDVKSHKNYQSANATLSCFNFIESLISTSLISGRSM
jgi:hypothetical protein